MKCLLNERLIGRVSGVIERTDEGGEATPFIK